MSKTGILLFAHGARDPAWARPFEAVRDQLRTQEPSTPIELAFLEFMAPDILTAGHSLASQGCQVITVVPLFLGAGGHVRKDLPALLQQLGEQHPQVSWQLSPAVGETELLINALAQTALALAQGRAPLLSR
ncbi:MAG: sirohydrochlorin chelatase [Aquabacterium sp.]